MTRQPSSSAIPLRTPEEVALDMADHHHHDEDDDDVVMDGRFDIQRRIGKAKTTDSDSKPGPLSSLEVVLVDAPVADAAAATAAAMAKVASAGVATAAAASCSSMSSGSNTSDSKHAATTTTTTTATPTTTTASNSTEAAPAATLPRENLYDSLVRYQEDHSIDDIAETQTIRSTPSQGTWYSVRSDDDRKLPARPPPPSPSLPTTNSPEGSGSGSAASYEGMYRAPIRRPYRPPGGSSSCSGSSAGGSRGSEGSHNANDAKKDRSAADTTATTATAAAANCTQPQHAQLPAQEAVSSPPPPNCTSGTGASTNQQPPATATATTTTLPIGERAAIYKETDKVSACSRPPENVVYSDKDDQTCLSSMVQSTVTGDDWYNAPIRSSHFVSTPSKEMARRNQFSCLSAAAQFSEELPMDNYFRETTRSAPDPHYHIASDSNDSSNANSRNHSPHTTTGPHAAVGTGMLTQQQEEWLEFQNIMSSNRERAPVVMTTTISSRGILPPPRTRAIGGGGEGIDFDHGFATGRESSRSPPPRQPYNNTTDRPPYNHPHTDNGMDHPHSNNNVRHPPPPSAAAERPSSSQYVYAHCELAEPRQPGNNSSASPRPPPSREHEGAGFPSSRGEAGEAAAPTASCRPNDNASNDNNESDDPEEQYRIWKEIQEELERKEMELVLQLSRKQSATTPGTTTPGLRMNNHNDRMNNHNDSRSNSNHINNDYRDNHNRDRSGAGNANHHDGHHHDIHRHNDNRANHYEGLDHHNDSNRASVHARSNVASCSNSSCSDDDDSSDFVYPDQHPKPPGAADNSGEGNDNNDDDDDDSELREAIRISQEEAAAAEAARNQAAASGEGDEDEIALALRLSEEQAEADRQRLQRLREAAGDLSEEEQLRLALEQSVQESASAPTRSSSQDSMDRANAHSDEDKDDDEQWRRAVQESMQEQSPRRPMERNTALVEEEDEEGGDDCSTLDEDMKLALRLSQAQLAEEERFRGSRMMRDSSEQEQGVRPNGLSMGNDSFTDLIQPLPTSSHNRNYPPTGAARSPPAQEYPSSNKGRWGNGLDDTPPCTTFPGAMPAPKVSTDDYGDYDRQRRHSPPRQGYDNYGYHGSPPPTGNSAPVSSRSPPHYPQHGSHAMQGGRPPRQGQHEQKFDTGDMDDATRDLLVREGQMDTRMAIMQGQSQIVTCRGCRGRLHAPLQCSMVFCPTCNVVSPLDEMDR